MIHRDTNERWDNFRIWLFARNSGVLTLKTLKVSLFLVISKRDNQKIFAPIHFQHETTIHTMDYNYWMDKRKRKSFTSSCSAEISPMCIISGAEDREKNGKTKATYLICSNTFQCKEKSVKIKQTPRFLLISKVSSDRYWAAQKRNLFLFFCRGSRHQPFFYRFTLATLRI